MDFNTFIAAVSSSLGLSLAGAYWLARTLVQHRLQVELETRKISLAAQLETSKVELNKQLEYLRGQLQAELARDKARIEGAVRGEVESFLGEAAAQRQYEFEARKRLYLSIGPLRFQLLLACRDLAGRVQALGSSERRYSLELSGYFGRSTVYRILRVLAIADAIEAQIALTDFSVDPSAQDCLRFRRSLTRLLSGDELLDSHPDADWTRQVQHIYADRLAVCAQLLVRTDGGQGPRILRFQEFNALLDAEGAHRVEPFDTLFNDFQPASKPLLWLRLVACAHACNALVDRLGADAGFEQRRFPTDSLLRECRDPVIAGDSVRAAERIAALALMPL